jgi:hypothetical protein
MTEKYLMSREFWTYMSKELIAQLEAEFEKLRVSLKLKHSFADYDRIFFLKDYVLAQKFISESFSRAICYRIVDTYNSWMGYLHGLIVPNPASMFNMEESQVFNDQDKEKIYLLMAKAASLTSKNGLIGVSRDKKLEAEFLNDVVDFWELEFRPAVMDIMKRVNEHWKMKSVSQAKNSKSI